MDIFKGLYEIQKHLQQRPVKQTVLNLKSPNFSKTSKSVISKPSYSEVVLTKEKELLEILIPPKGFNPNLLPYIVFAISWNAFLVCWHFVVINTWSMESFLMALFSLCCLGICIGLTLQNLFNLFGKIWLSIDKSKIALSYQIFDFKYNYPRPAPRDQISKLEIIRKVYFQKDYEGELVEVKPQINLLVGTKKFVLVNAWLELIGTNLLRQAEIEWLAYELSVWLDLPIIYT